MILGIASAAFRECIRRSFPYIAVSAIVITSCASTLLHLFTFGGGAQEAMNLAISGVLLIGLLNAAFVGTTLVRTDLERGTLALMLSQPVGPAFYVAGRFLGLAMATLLLCTLTAGGIALTLVVTGLPDGALFGAPLLLGWARATLAVLVLAAAALALSAATGRLFAPVLLLLLFVAGDVAGSGLLARLLPGFGLFGLDAARSPSLPWLSLYSALYSVVFLVITYLQLVLRPPIRIES